MKFSNLYIYKSPQFNVVTKNIDYFYTACITVESGKKHEVKLNLTEKENNKIIKLIAPILERAFSDIKEKVIRELE